MILEKIHSIGQGLNKYERVYVKEWVWAENEWFTGNHPMDGKGNKIFVNLESLRENEEGIIKNIFMSWKKEKDDGKNEKELWNWNGMIITGIMRNNVGALWILLGLLSCSSMLMMRRVRFGMKLECNESGLDCGIWFLDIEEDQEEQIDIWKEDTDWIERRQGKNVEENM